MKIILKINAIGIPALGEASAKQTDNKSDSDERNRTASTTIGATNINPNIQRLEPDAVVYESSSRGS